MPGIIAYPWETASSPFAATANVIPMYLALMSNTGLTIGEIAQAAYATLEASPERPLFLRHMGEQRTGVANIRNDTYYDFMVNGPRVDEWKAAMQEFWIAWGQMGTFRPSRIVLEFEQHYSWYAIPGDNPARAAAVQAVRDAGYSRRYPAEFNAFTQAVLAAHNNHLSPSAPALAIHDTLVTQRMNKALAEVALGTYASILGGPIPPSSNYGDNRLRTPFTSPYSYTFPAKTVCVGSDSSPHLYFRPDGARFSGISGDGPKQFAAMKAMIEQIRAMRGPIVPWVGTPAYRGDGFALQTNPSAWAGWRKFIHTLALHGVREVLYFVGGRGSGANAETSEERAYAQETFATATTVRPRPIDRFQRPPIDTTTLLTGTGGWVENQFAYNAGDWE